MATLSIYIADIDSDRVFDAIATNFSYQNTVPNPNGIGTIPNPQSKAVFANSVIRGFITQHVKLYEIEKAKQEAAAAIEATAGNVVVGDGQSSTPYLYYMVCLEPAREQYNAMAAVIAPGNSFDIPLSESGAEPVSHYGAVVSITEDAKAQLLALELFGGTQSSGVQTLFYVRCDAETSTAVYTNIGGFAVGGVCSLGSVLTALNLKEMGV